MRMTHVMHEEVELGLGKLIDLSSLLLRLSTVLDGCLNSSDEKEGQSYREQCGLRVGGSTDEQAERPATESGLHVRLAPQSPLLLEWNSLKNHLHPPPGRFTVVPKALIKKGLLGRPIKKHKTDHPLTQ